MGEISAKVFCVVLFFLCVSPLASLYMVWCTFQTKQMTLLDIVNNPNTTLEELWNVLFPDEPYHYDLVRADHQELLGVFNQAQSLQNLQHFRVVIPWFLTFVCGVFVPIVLSTLRQRRRRRRWNSKLEQKATAFFRKQLDTCSVCLESRISATDNSSVLWKVDGGQSLTTEPSCTICLQQFQASDVVSSSSSSCCHVVRVSAVLCLRSVQHFYFAGSTHSGCVFL